MGVGVFFSSLMLLAAVPAGADDLAAPTLFGQEVRQVEPLTPLQLQERKAALDQMLEEKGWVQIGDQVRPGNKATGFTQNPDPAFDWTTPPHRNTIFLNFFGAAMSPGTNAALNQSPCLSAPMDWPGFNGTEAQALALIEVFERQMEPYGIRIAFEEVPPPELPYAMVMMGGSPGLLGFGNGVLGVSCSGDCGDFWWRDATFAFTDNINPNNAATLGTTALHEAAHAFGLAHIDDPTKVMNPFVGSADVIWANGCTPYNDATGGINCQATHDEFCDGGAQNTAAELLAYFGENSPDMEEPTVTITNPPGDIELPVGGGVTIEAEIDDNHEGFGWKLVIPEVGQESVAFAFERSWELSNLPEGTYTARVEAIDHERNIGFDEVKIYVGVEAPESTGGDDGSSSTDGDSEGDSEADSDSASGTSSDGADDGASDGADTEGGSGGGAAADDGGCGCTTSDEQGFGFAGLLMLGLGLVRRRR
ncbi:MAG: MYXO-CTERM sorting domain-containing protein [Myxococcota bacterium]